MLSIKNIPYESRIISFATDTMPIYSEKKQDWILITKQELAGKIQKLQKEENGNKKISELLNMADDPDLKISSITKNKSIRLNLNAAVKIMSLSLLNKKNKTDIFKIIIKQDLVKKINDLTKRKNVKSERIEHLKKISTNWLELKQEQDRDLFTLGYTYYKPSENVIEYLIDTTINYIRIFLKTNNVPKEDIEKFLKKFINKRTVTNSIEAEGFDECHEVEIVIKNKKPHIVIKMNIPPYFPIKEEYDSYESFEKDVPKAIQPLLEKMFWTEELRFEDPNNIMHFFIPKKFPLIDLSVDFDKNNKLLIEGVNIQDDKFIDKVLQKITKSKPNNLVQINKKIVNLTAQGRYDEALKLQNEININKNEVETNRFYLQIIKELPNQIFSFTISKNLLIILDSLLNEKSAEERIFSWAGEKDDK